MTMQAPVNGKLHSAEATLRQLMSERAGGPARLLDEVSESFQLDATERTELELRFATELHAERIRTRLAAERNERFGSLARRVMRVVRVAVLAVGACVGLAFVIMWAIDTRDRRDAESRPSIDRSVPAAVR